VRTTLLAAAIVATLGLAACSSGGSQAIPGSQSLAPMGSGFSTRLAVEGIAPDNCPSSKYIGCITVAKGHPAKYTICITTTTSCNSGSFPGEKWSSKILTLKKKLYKGIVGTFKPNPGDPTNGTVTAKVKLKNSGGKVAFVQAVKACPTAGGSCSTNDIGIITK
jgi:hypothetical protein